MSDLQRLDIAKADTWLGCKPGMTRAEVQSALKLVGVDASAYGEDNLTATLDGVDAEFYFTKDGADRLLQISLEGDGLLWNDKPLSELPLDEMMQTIARGGQGFWSTDDASDDPYADTAPAPADATPVADADLLKEGTVWFPERGLGVVIWQGKVFFVVWRAAKDLPKHFVGPVTELQRELSRRPDLTEHLREKAAASAIAARPKDPMRYFRRVLALAAIAAFALTGREAFREMTLWNAAPVVPGKLLAIEKGVQKEFFEYLPAPVTRHLPEWLLAGRISSARPQVDLYRVQYTDPHDQPREALLEGAEFYVAPREIGDPVELTFLDENPPRVKGPARARDSAFLEHMPWAITIGGLWLILSTALTAVPFLLRLLKPALRKMIAANSSVVTDRPELR